MQYIKTGSVTRIFSEDDVEVTQELEAATYIVKHSDDIGYYLQKTSDISQSGKIYGNQQKRVDRILNTFGECEDSMGVLLIGTKGSGKTHLTRLISDTVDLPVIIVNSKFVDEKFLSFIKMINTTCVIIFDEFEKIYPKSYSQEGNCQQKLLTLLDGIYKTRHLFLFTANNESDIDELFINRPGRIYYRFDYHGLEKDFIEEYCKDNLNDQSYLEEIIKVSNLFNDFNFDMLQALVKEVNLYDETPLDCLSYLNINPTTDKITYDVIVELEQTGEIVAPSKYFPTRVHINPLKDKVHLEIEELSSKGREVPVASSNSIDELVDGDDKTYVFDHKLIDKFDVSDGVYSYKAQEGYVLKLVAQKETFFDFKKAL